MKKLVTTIALLLWASQAWAQQSTQAGGTGCSTPATAARLGVMSPTIGTVCTITDGASATDCTTGGGTDNVTCFYCGAAWQSSSCGGASGGTDVALDLGDTGSNDSAAINKIATSGDTNSIFTEPAADKLLIDVSQNWPACDAATAADDLSASCNQCVDISANTNLSVGAGLFLNPTSDEITVLSNASGFLHDGGATSLTCTTGTDGRIQVMDDGSLEYCDGAATSVLQSYDPGTTLTAGTGLSGDFVIDTSSTINCADAAADGSTKGCSTFDSNFTASSGVISLQTSHAGSAHHDAVTLAGTPNYITLSGQQLTLTKLDITDDTNLIAASGLAKAGNILLVSSQEEQFLADGGTTDLTCSSPQGFGSMQVMDDGSLQWCDGATTPALQTTNNFARKNVLDIRDYGAVCDGSTDAASSINSAITASEEGDIIFFPGCTNAWRISSTISLPSTHSITILGGGSAIDATVGTSDVFAIEDVGQAVNSPQHVIEGLRIYNAGTQGQGNAIRIEDSNSQTLRNLYIQDFDTGINLELDGGFTEANKIEDVRIHDCNTGIYWEKVSGTSSSFASTHLEHVEIVMAAAAAATPIGMDVGAATSIYRSRFDNVIVFPSQTDSIGFYCQGTLRSVTGSLHVESTNGSATGNTGIDLAAGCSLMTVDLDVDIRGTIANDFVNGSGSGISGLRVQNISNFPGAEIRDATQKQYFSGSICDDDLSTCRYRKTMSTAGVLRHEFDETLPMEFIDLTTEDIAPVRMKDIGNECDATADDLTPPVADCTQINLATYSAGSVVTDFDDGISGQTLLVRLQDTDVTVESDNTNIRLNDDKDFTCSDVHCVLYLWLDGATWREISRTDNTSGTYVSKTGDTMSGDLAITDVAAGSVLTLTGLESEDTLLLASENATSPSNNDAVALAMSVENSANTQVVGGRIFMQMVDVTSGSEESQMSFQILDDQSGNPITPLRFTNSSSGLPSVTVNPDLTDIDFIHWSAPAGGPVQTIACDAGTGVCNFANSPTVAGVADPTYVAVTGDAMTGALNIDASTTLALQAYSNVGTDATYARLGCDGDGVNGAFCNIELTADNSVGTEVGVAQIRHTATDTDNGSLDGRVEILVKSGGIYRGLQQWVSNAGGTKTVVVNPSNLDVDFRVYGDTTNNVFACDGSTEVCSFLNPPTGLSETTMTKFQTGAPGFNGTSTQETAGEAYCVKWFVPGRIADADTMDFVLSTGTGATEVVELGTYSADGQTQYFECTVPTGSGTGSLNCSNDNATPAAIPPGDVWMCVTTSTGTVAFVSMHASTNQGRYCTHTETVTSGELPDTLTSPSCTWTNLLPAYLGLSDE